MNFPRIENFKPILVSWLPPVALTRSKSGNFGLPEGIKLSVTLINYLHRVYWRARSAALQTYAKQNV